MPYEKELQTAIDAVRSAAKLCRSVQARLADATLKKDDRSPVTVADFGSQALICRDLQRAFPDDPVIAEEDSAALRDATNAYIMERVEAEVRAIVADAGADLICGWIDRGNAAAYSDRFWTLDPIDGTKGFLRGDQYAIALALIVEGDVQVAALACPVLPASDGSVGTIFAAVRGGGASSYTMEPTSARTPVQVSAVSDPSAARFCESFESAHSSHGDAAALADLLGITREPLRIDSQAKYAVVARGDADIYLRLTKRTGYVEKIWDHAAGALVIEEAGGRVTDLNGAPLDFSQGTRLERNVGIVASNGLLHERVLEALDRVLVS